MPHPELVARVAAALESAKEASHVGEVERRAHNFLVMLEAAVGRPLPAPEPNDTDEPAPAEPPAEPPPAPEPVAAEPAPEPVLIEDAQEPVAEEPPAS